MKRAFSLLVLTVAGVVTPLSMPAAERQLPSLRRIRPPLALTPPEVVMQTGHERDVRGLAFHPDHTHAATASDDWSIALWNLRAGVLVRRFVGHTAAATAIVFSPDGTRLYSGSHDQTIRVWDVRSGAQLQRFPIRVSGLAAVDGNVRSNGGRVHSLAIDPGGRSLLAGTVRGALLLDAATGAEKRWFPRLQTDVYSVAFSPDGTRAVVAYWDGAREWDLSSFDRKQHYDKQGDEKDTVAAGFSRDGDFVFTANAASLVIFRRDTGRRVATIGAGASAIKTAAASGAENVLAVAHEDGTIVIRRFPGADAVQTMRRIWSDPASLAFNRKGDEVFAGFFRGALGWNRSSGRLSASLTAPIEYLTHVPTAFAVEPRKNLLISGSLAGGLTVFNLRSGQIDRRFQDVTGPIQAVVASPDGERVLTAAYNGHVVQDDIASGRRIADARLNAKVSAAALRSDSEAVIATDDGVLLVDLRASSVVKRFRRFAMANSTADVESVVLDGSGRYLVGGFHDSSGGVRVWNLDTGDTVKTLGGNVLTRGWATGHTDPINAVAISADGKVVASGSDDRTARIWTLPGGAERCRATHDDKVTKLVMDSAARRMVTVAGHRARLWDANCAPVRDLVGHWSEVVDLRFSPADPSTLISLATERTIRFWDLETGRERFMYVPLSKRAWLFMTPEGLFDGTPGAWQAVAWRFGDATVPAEVFLRDFFRPNLAREILSGRSPQPPRPLSSVDRRLPSVSMRLGDPSQLTAGSRLLDVEVSVEAAAPTTARPARGTVQGVRLFRNGRLVQTWPAVDSAAPLRTKVPIIAGQNTLTAYAFNGDNVKSQEASADVTGPASLQRPGRTYVIAVGINRFLQASVPPLAFAEGDAAAFADELTRRGTALGREVKRVRLIGRDATQERILRVLRRLAGQELGPVIEDGVSIDAAQPEDVVMLYFATHGRVAGDDYHLWPYNVGAATPGPASRGNSISRQVLEPLLERIGAGELLFIADACYSGQLLETRETVGPFNSAALAQLAYDKGMSVVTASQSHQAAIETSMHGRGLLTYALINEGIQQMRADTAPADGAIAVREWLEYAEARVPLLFEEIERQKKAVGDAVRALRRGDGAAGQGFQQPRIFFRADGDDRPVIIARR